MEYARYTAQQETMHDLRCMVHGAHTAHDRISIPTPPSYQADTHCSQSTKKTPTVRIIDAWLEFFVLILPDILCIYFKFA